MIRNRYLEKTRIEKIVRNKKLTLKLFRKYINFQRILKNLFYLLKNDLYFHAYITTTPFFQRRDAMLRVLKKHISLPFSNPSISTHFHKNPSYTQPHSIYKVWVNVRNIQSHPISSSNYGPLSLQV